MVKMSQDKVILATTEVIDGVMLTKESLVYAVATINGEKALRPIVDHDPCSIPLGKARAAEVVDIGKTAALLVIPDETHRVATSIHEPRNLAGNPDSPQVVVFLATIIDVTVGS